MTVLVGWREALRRRLTTELVRWWVGLGRLTAHLISGWLTVVVSRRKALRGLATKLISRWLTVLVSRLVTLLRIALVGLTLLRLTLVGLTLLRLTLVGLTLLRLTLLRLTLLGLTLLGLITLLRARMVNPRGRLLSRGATRC